ncbi:MAG: TonB-dependent receptor [Bacteroidales bacterium]|jgi:outer membrane cobalamin receptor|nr:TonB-dependent receptor [Bacteroidales bacterium]
MLILGYLPFGSFSQNEDTIRQYQLPTITIVDSAMSQRPLEQSNVHIDRTLIEKQSVTSAGEIAKFIPGVTVKDYGGLGGLKTISVRGLGTSHTAVMYDGISVSDYMNGQIDLSKYSTANIKEVNMSNGADFNLLQPAKALSSSNIFMIETIKPKFEMRERAKVNAFCSYGSFNYFNPGFALALKMTEKWITTLDFDFINSAGNYPYLLRYGRNEGDSTSKERRTNADLLSLRTEWNNYITFSSQTDLKLKFYYFYSNRGLPSATIYYYLNSHQRLWDRNAFAQSVLTHNFNEHFTYRNYSKVSVVSTHYFDGQVLNANGFQSDIYQQKEGYVNNVFSYQSKQLGISLTNDLTYNTLDATANVAVSPKRFSSLTAAIFAFDLYSFTFNANILHTCYHDNTSYEYMESKKYGIHPFLSLGYRFKDFAFSIFYKDIERYPTFNELYYNRIGTPNLKPERTKQFNFHWAYRKNFSTKRFLQLNTSFDAYYNQVLDKIVAMPQRNLFVWSMLNYGKVQVSGIDLLASIRTNIRSVNLHLQGTYSFQYAVDNEETSLTYQQQIPYTPRNSGSILAIVDFKSWSASYTLSFMGKRYALNENIAANRLDAYCEHSVGLQKKFGKNFVLSLSVLNLLNYQYEIVKNYPMPLRQFRIKINYKFN